MIATEIQPSDPAWLDLCAEQRVAVVWGPDNLNVIEYDARRAYEKQRDETKKLWRAFSEEKSRVEADGGEGRGVATLETEPVRTGLSRQAAPPPPRRHAS